mmetsp:Transcript_1216/g.4975  ORF Transcript_1216/g.4975 Transcript_1216/m.4975 type:complete len:435 (-) Transcript_1216:1677-2981(-)
MLRRDARDGRRLVVVVRVLEGVEGAAFRVLPVVVFAVGVKGTPLRVLPVVVVVLVAVLVARDRVAVLIVEGLIVLPLRPVRFRRVLSRAARRLAEHLLDLLIQRRLAGFEGVLLLRRGGRAIPRPRRRVDVEVEVAEGFGAREAPTRGDRRRRRHRLAELDELEVIRRVGHLRRPAQLGGVLLGPPIRHQTLALGFLEKLLEVRQGLAPGFSPPGRLAVSTEPFGQVEEAVLLLELARVHQHLVRLSRRRRAAAVPEPCPGALRAVRAARRVPLAPGRAVEIDQLFNRSLPRRSRRNLRGLVPLRIHRTRRGLKLILVETPLGDDRGVPLRPRLGGDGPRLRPARGGQVVEGVPLPLAPAVLSAVQVGVKIILGVVVVVKRAGEIAVRGGGSHEVLGARELRAGVGVSRRHLAGPALGLRGVPFSVAEADLLTE